MSSMFTSAPADINVLKQNESAANIRAVLPFLFHMFTLAPALMSSLRQSASPFVVADISAPLPWYSHMAFTSAPAAISSFTQDSFPFSGCIHKRGFSATVTLFLVEWENAFVTSSFHTFYQTKKNPYNKIFQRRLQSKNITNICFRRYWRMTHERHHNKWLRKSLHLFVSFNTTTWCQK